MPKIWFGRPGAQLDPSDFKGRKSISWCREHLGPLAFIFPLGRLPKLPDEESPISPSMRNYRFVVVEVEEKDGDAEPGYYLCSRTPKEVWEKL